MTAPDTAALLDALDRVREVRGSVALFDALVSGDVARVQGAVAAWPRHPLRGDAVAWLAARGAEVPAPETPAAALARHGITDVNAWISAAAAREATLARSLEEARAERDTALRSANAYALVAALLAVIALAAGVAAALSAETPPQPEPARTTNTEAQ